MMRRTRTSAVILAASAAFLLLAAQASAAGVCRIQYETKNKSRYVHGPVDVECGFSSGEIHTAPFGNWGVETESSGRRDGNQFQGWCRWDELCDNDGDCSTYCKDTWYQWHSCTTRLPQYRAPNDDFFNHEDGTEQKSKFSTVNAHGGGRLDLVVGCPLDTDGDYFADEGGCKGALDSGFSIGGHRMELYELDGTRPDDDEVGTLKFPTLHASMSGVRCDIYGCTGSSRDGPFESKESGSTRLVSAKAAIQVTGAEFVDAFGSCCDPLSDPGCN